MSDTVYKMQKRVEQYSTEAQAYQEGDNRITVEIPGVTDADKILNDLGKIRALCVLLNRQTRMEIRTLLPVEKNYELTRSLDEIREAGSVVFGRYGCCGRRRRYLPE